MVLKKVKLLFLLLLLVGFAKGQQAAKKRSIGVSAAFSLPYSNFERYPYGYRELGYTAGMTMVTEAHRSKWATEFGLLFTLRNISYNFDREYYRNQRLQHISQDVDWDRNPVVSSTELIREYAVSVPLRVLFQAGKGKWKFVSGAGMNVRIDLAYSNALHAVRADGSELSMNYARFYEDKEIFAVPNLSAGVRYNIGTDFFIRSEILYATAFNLPGMFDHEPAIFAKELQRNQYGSISLGIFRQF